MAKLTIVVRTPPRLDCAVKVAWTCEVSTACKGARAPLGKRQSSL